MKSWFLCILAGLMLLSLAACGEKALPVEPQESSAPSQSVQESSEEAVSGLLSKFSTTDLEGNALDESSLADYQLTMVNVWATYCGPCLQEMPDLGELAAEYAPRGVQIMGFVTDVLNSDGSLSQSQLQTARDIVRSTGASYPHFVPSQDLYGLLGEISAVPTTFFVDRQGRQVGSAYIGARSKEDWVNIIEEVLPEVDP